MKPMLASDWDEKKQKFPVIAMPKDKKDKPRFPAFQSIRLEEDM